MSPIPNWLDVDAWQWLTRIYWANFSNEAVRYLLVSSLLWLSLHVVFKNKMVHRLIANWSSRRDFAAVALVTVMLVINEDWMIYLAGLSVQPRAK